MCTGHVHCVSGCALCPAVGGGGATVSPQHPQGWSVLRGQAHQEGASQSHEIIATGQQPLFAHACTHKHYTSPSLQYVYVQCRCTRQCIFMYMYLDSQVSTLMIHTHIYTCLCMYVVHVYIQCIMESLFSLHVSTLYRHMYMYKNRYMYMCISTCVCTRCIHIQIRVFLLR